ncbi:MAG: phytase [Bacteroidota bacterium]
MKINLLFFPFVILTAIAIGCSKKNTVNEVAHSTSILKPKYITEKVNYDSDDPAIWVNAAAPGESLILGTDKMENEKGAVFAFDLSGKIDTVIAGIDRPNNIDLAYGFPLGDDTIDIAVVTERIKGQVRIMTVPSMRLVDAGGIPVFEDDTYNAVMGIAIYKKPATHDFYMIVSRKENPDQNNDYLYQYILKSVNGVVKAKLVRKFGQFEGSTEIEAIAVDNELGYVYYSDEGYGIRKYYADPEMGNEELAVFGLQGFKEDREGISIYKSSKTTGYILVSDQQANAFQVFPREGMNGNPHQHELIRSIRVQANESDGSEVTHIPLNDDFSRGLFVAMSDNKTFELYSWTSIEEALKQKY